MGPGKVRLRNFIAGKRTIPGGKRSSSSEKWPTLKVTSIGTCTASIARSSAPTSTPLGEEPESRVLLGAAAEALVQRYICGLTDQGTRSPFVSPAEKITTRRSFCGLLIWAASSVLAVAGHICDRRILPATRGTIAMQYAPDSENGESFR